MRIYYISSNALSDLTDHNLDAVSPELRILGVGRVMDDVSQKMQRKAIKKNEDPLKILVNCTHDTTIAGVLQTLGVYDQKLVAHPNALPCVWLTGPILDGRRSHLR